MPLLKARSIWVCSASIVALFLASACGDEGLGVPCLIDGEVYADGSSVPSPDSCNSCTCDNGGRVCTLIACPEPVGCGARLGDTCEPDQYCAYEEGAYCGAADATAVCEQRPEFCAEIYDPVCGCDGVTYGNACEAARAGVGYSDRGECEGDGASCEVNGVTYPDGASGIPAPDGCNICSCIDGGLACTRRACDP